uniref:Uncharacterized protein n=1 Tax=Helianthus annuus TaxID=4232 RepID=A0A251SYC0_HELAN
MYFQFIKKNISIKFYIRGPPTARIRGIISISSTTTLLLILSIQFSYSKLKQALQLINTTNCQSKLSSLCGDE